MPPRLAEHFDAIGAAHGSPAKLLEALAALPEDRALPEVPREVIVRVLAQDAALAYLEIAEGRPILPTTGARGDRVQLR